MVYFMIENMSSRFHKEINLYNSFLTDKFYWVDTDQNKKKTDGYIEQNSWHCIHQSYTLTVFKTAVYFICMTRKIRSHPFHITLPSRLLNQTQMDKKWVSDICIHEVSITFNYIPSWRVNSPSAPSKIVTYSDIKCVLLSLI